MSGQALTPPSSDGGFFQLRCKLCWLTSAVLLLIVASFWSLDLKWSEFLGLEAASKMGRFIGEFFPPDTSPVFLRKLWTASLETLAMSALGTLLAAVGGIMLALPASRQRSESAQPQAQGQAPGANAADPTASATTPATAPATTATSSARSDRSVLLQRNLARILLNALRSIPELVWAALLLISAGLGPFAGTLALACHTAGVLGRLFAEAIENAPPGPAFALRVRGVGVVRVFLFATLPQVLPQLVSYTLYRWENNIRAAAVLGVVGAGGLGQLLAFHMGLFHMQKTASILVAMLILVAIVDAASEAVRRLMAR